MRVLPRVKRRWRWLAAFIFLLWLAVLAADRLWPLPLHDVTPARVVVAEDGTPLWRFADAQGVWRYPVTLADVSPRYLQALIQYEDRWFWRHPGVNPFAVLRAAWQDLTSGRVISGGSTLTMQVARLLDPHPRTFGGKLRQLWRALQLEWHLSKSDILTLYLNRAPFGGTLQGIGAASWAYLGKPPASLSYGEAALLAVLPQAPSRLRPDRWPQRAQAARDKVLTRMVSQGVWPEQAVKEAMEEPVWLFPRQMPQLAPLFSRRALATSRDEKVVTTLDAGLQRQLEDLALNWKSRLPPRSSLAMVVVDHTDMKVRGWVGSADITDDSRFGHIDMVSAVRSPGSVLKPFIYAMAMDEGLIHPASLLQDVPRRFSDYRPGNFDSGFHGPVSASEALVRSLNLPAVQVLEAYGPKRFAANLRNAGLPLTLPAGAEPNLSLILGGCRGAAGRYCRGVQRLRPPWQGGAAAPEAERPIDRARADVARGGMDRPAYFGRRSATGSRCLAAAGGAAGVENRHQLRLSRRVGGRPQCAISDRHLDRPPGRYAGGGPVWLRQRRTAAQPGQ